MIRKNELRAQITRLTAELADERAHVRALEALAGQVEYDAITTFRPKIAFESEIRFAARVIMRAIKGDEPGVITQTDVIDFDLGIKVVKIGDLFWLVSADDERVVLMAQSWDVAMKIGMAIAEEAYDSADEMEGDDVERLRRALADATSEEEIRIWAITAQETGEL